MDIAYGYGLPPDISTHGAEIDQLIAVVHWFMGLLFVGWGIFFVYCLFRFRKRQGHVANYALPHAKISKYAEGGVAIFEIFLLLGLSAPVWAHVKEAFPEESEALRIRVVAEQFAWNVHYPGLDGTFGRTNPEMMASDNLIGLDLSDPAAADDVVMNNIFHMPANKPIIVELTSKDVIHSFAIPVMRVKQDVIPGMMIPIWFEATQEGNFQIACAQLCGNNHYTMKADLIIESESAFNDWISSMSSDDEEEEEVEEDD